MVVGIAKKIWSKLKMRAFVGRNVRVGRNFHLGILSFISSPTTLSIGDDVYVGKFCTLQCSGSIGRGVLIANNVGVIGRRDHDFREIGSFVRSSRWVGSDAALASHPKNSITIGDDVWIGFGAVIVSGITVGRGAIIAAGALVDADVPPYAIVGGSPATVRGMRFTPEQIIEHEAKLPKAHV